MSEKKKMSAEEIAEFYGVILDIEGEPEPDEEPDFIVELREPTEEELRARDQLWK